MGEIYVVPDKQMPRRRAYGQEVAPQKWNQSLGQLAGTTRRQYGEEVPVQDWEQALGQLNSLIKAHRAQNPVYSPFPAGTKTLAGKQFEHNREMDRAAQALKVASGRSSGSGGGGGTGTEKPPGTLEERKAKATSELLKSAQKLSSTPLAHDPEGGLNLEQVLNWLYSPEVQAEAREKLADVEWVARELVRMHTGKSLEEYLRGRPADRIPAIIREKFPGAVAGTESTGGALTW